MVDAAARGRDRDPRAACPRARARAARADADRLARQGISKEAYLRIAGKDEETLAHEAEPEAAKALRREAVLEAVVEAERIEPTDERLLEELEPAAERAGRLAEVLARRA